MSDLFFNYSQSKAYQQMVGKTSTEALVQLTNDTSADSRATSAQARQVFSSQQQRTPSNAKTEQTPVLRIFVQPLKAKTSPKALPILKTIKAAATSIRNQIAQQPRKAWIAPVAVAAIGTVAYLARKQISNFVWPITRQPDQCHLSLAEYCGELNQNQSKCVDLFPNSTDCNTKEIDFRNCSDVHHAHLLLQNQSPSSKPKQGSAAGKTKTPSKQPTTKTTAADQPVPAPSPTKQPTINPTKADQPVPTESKEIPPTQPTEIKLPPVEPENGWKQIEDMFQNAKENPRVAAGAAGVAASAVFLGTFVINKIFCSPKQARTAKPVSVLTSTNEALAVIAAGKISLYEAARLLTGLLHPKVPRMEDLSQQIHDNTPETKGDALLIQAALHLARSHNLANQPDRKPLAAPAYKEIMADLEKLKADLQANTSLQLDSDTGDRVGHYVELAKKNYALLAPSDPVEEVEEKKGDKEKVNKKKVKKKVSSSANELEKLNWKTVRENLVNKAKNILEMKYDNLGRERPQALEEALLMTFNDLTAEGYSKKVVEPILLKVIAGFRSWSLTKGVKEDKKFLKKSLSQDPVASSKTPKPDASIPQLSPAPARQSTDVVTAVVPVQ